MSSLAKTAKPKRLGGKTLGRRIAENWQLYLLLVIPIVITIMIRHDLRTMPRREPLTG